MKTRPTPAAISAETQQVDHAILGADRIRRARNRCTKEFIRCYAKLIGSGLTHVRASAIMRVDRVTVFRWRQENRDFDREIERETAKAIAARLRIVNLAAESDPRLALWWLEHTHAGEYAARTVGVQVNVGPSSQLVAIDQGHAERVLRDEIRAEVLRDMNATNGKEPNELNG